MPAGLGVSWHPLTIVGRFRSSLAAAANRPVFQQHHHTVALHTVRNQPTPTHHRSHTHIRGRRAEQTGESIARNLARRPAQSCNNLIALGGELTAKTNTQDGCLCSPPFVFITRPKEGLSEWGRRAGRNSSHNDDEEQQRDEGEERDDGDEPLYEPQPVVAIGRVPYAHCCRRCCCSYCAQRLNLRLVVPASSRRSPRGPTFV
jgi:hypothetical protein